MSARVVMVLGVALATAFPGPANAWRHGGWWGPRVIIGVPGPIYLGPPAGYYYAPQYYAPPYPTPPYPTPPYPTPAGQACYAGAYVCPLDQIGPQGAPCSCPTNNGRVGGRVG